LICEESPVLELAQNSGIWQAKTPSGCVSAPKIIMATNGHVESFGFFKRRLIHLFLYASMTRPLSPDEVKRLGGDSRWGITPSDPVGSSIRRISGRSGDRILVRNQSTYAASMEVPDRYAAAKQRHHAKSFADRFPDLCDVGMEFSWGGKLCLSLNDVPAFGEIEDGIFSACCQNGLGTARGTMSGMLAADLACGNRHDNHQSLAKMLSLPAPRKLPPEPFATIGAWATLKYREWRAGREL
jgi:glycine/D-amino acid oxidase-like deaminating enzyme